MMTEWESRIRELKALINGRDQEMKQLKGSLGRQLYDHFRKELPAGEIAEAVGPIDRLNREIPDLQRFKQSILKKIDRDENIKEQTEQLKLEKKSVLDQMKSFYVEIGKHAYIHYKESGADDPVMGDLFRDLSRTEERIRELDKDLYLSGSPGESGFFNNLMQKGKALYLASRRKTLAAGMATAYRKAGEEICTTTLFDELADTEFSEIAAPYRENRQKIERIEAEEEKLRTEARELKEDLKKLCEGKTSRRKIAEIDHKAVEKNRELDNAYRELGTRFAAGKETPAALSAAQKELLGRIRSLEEDNNRDRKEITQLETRISMEKKGQSIERKNSRIEILDQEIARKKQEIKDLKKDIAQLEQEIDADRTFLESEGVTVALPPPEDSGK